MLTLCSSRAGALVGIDKVDAGASVLTRLRGTLIYLLATVYSMVSGNTLQRETKKGKKTQLNLVPVPVSIQQQRFSDIFSGFRNKCWNINLVN